MKNTDMTNTLLLVDDDATFCQVLSRALEKRGYVVVVGQNLTAAYELALTKPPQFAIVDLRIGRESGLCLIEKLKRINDKMKIVILTGYASIATAVEAIKLGAVHYLTKPAGVDEILKALVCEPGDQNVSINTRPVSVKRLEWEHLQKVLMEHNGNISAAARALGMHRRTLQRKLYKKPSKQ